MVTHDLTLHVQHNPSYELLRCLQGDMHNTLSALGYRGVLRRGRAVGNRVPVLWRVTRTWSTPFVLVSELERVAAELRTLGNSCGFQGLTRHAHGCSATYVLLRCYRVHPC